MSGELDALENFQSSSMGFSDCAAEADGGSGPSGFVADSDPSEAEALRGIKFEDACCRSAADSHMVASMASSSDDWWWSRSGRGGCRGRCFASSHSPVPLS